jgi:translation initiation factor IF-2
MSIKLIKISKDLNVGISSLIEFLHKKGFTTVEANPNTRVDDEQYNLLLKEFGKDKQIKQETDRYKELHTRDKKKESVSIEGYEEPVAAPKVKKVEEIKTEIPEDRIPHFQIVDKINLDGDKPVKVAEEKPAVEEKKLPEPEVVVPEPIVVEEDIKPVQPEPEPVVQQVLQEEVIEAPAKPEPKPEPEPEPEPIPEKRTIAIEKVVEQPKEIVEINQPEMAEEITGQATVEEKIFRPNTTTLKTNIVVKGTIDLSSINDKTRPAKKTKAEKKKERMERTHVQEVKKVKDAAPASNNLKLLKKETLDEQKKAKIESPEDAAKKKRKRIKKEKIDIEKGATNFPPKDRASHNLRKPTLKTNVSEEDVQKQVKETLARLTSKGGKNKGAKHRRDKRDAFTQRQQEELEMQEQESRILKITEFVTANDLANMMNVPVVQVISTCMSIGMMVSINQRLDAETINIVADEFGFKTQYVSAEVVEAIAEEEDAEEDLEPRAPIVTVMGHVDHGKTSLLDNIRQTNVIAGEAGGITQHIGAYNVKLNDGRRITFLDTPGHEAFTAMRARGAKVTDVAIIIVAADDSVMPQTVEAINHASAAGVPIVFAINKIDKPGANPEKIKEALANMNYLVESWGGKYQSQEISAKKGVGINELLEKVSLEAELLDLKANPNKKAVGSVIESSLDKGRGYVSTILVENGTLKQGDIVLAGTYYGRVKAMFNERNQRIEEAAPSAPALILGLNGAPQAGDKFHVLETEQEAREIANKREQLQREQGLRTQKLLTLDDIGRRIAIGNFQQLNVIVKGDVDGSVEALSDSLIRLSTEEIQVNVIHKAVGQISESDITLAAASDAILVGFQVRPSQAARRIAEKEGVDIRLYSIIYDAIDEVKAAMEGMLSPEIKEEITANVEVREVFKITKVGTVAGCMVKEGKIKRNNKIRLVRDGIVIYSGDLGSLKRYKDDVKEVASGYECGLNINNYSDIKVGDIIEAFEQTEVKKTL